MFYEKLADENGHLYFNRYTKSRHPQYTTIPHYHASFEIYVMAKGSFPVYLNGEARMLQAGEIAFVDGLLPHMCGQSEYEDEFEVFVIVASKRFFDNHLDTQRIASFTKKSDATVKILEFVENAYIIKEEMNREMRLGFANYLLGLLLNYCTSDLPIHKKRSELTVEIMRYIDTSFREEITLEALAKKFGYTPTYISRSFNKYAGVNLHEYMNRVRYGQTKKLLETDKNITVADAALACGFQSVKTYYRIAKIYQVK